MLLNVSLKWSKACRWDEWIGRGAAAKYTTVFGQRRLSHYNVSSALRVSQILGTECFLYFMTNSPSASANAYYFLKMNLQIGIFCLPPTSVIPLHNHPGMTVFSKLLFGTMHIRSFDWADAHPKRNFLDLPPFLFVQFTICKWVGVFVSGDGDGDGLRLAKVKLNSEFRACSRTSILYPADGGNMHRFTAKTACAVLDVLGPPYCDPDGRHCQYYHEFPFNVFPGTPQLQSLNTHTLSIPYFLWFTVKNVSVDEGEYVWLKERDMPKDHIVVGVPYNGPKILKKWLPYFAFLSFQEGMIDFLVGKFDVNTSRELLFTFSYSKWESLPFRCILIFFWV